MVSRVDVEAVDIEEATIESLTERFVESKYSRIFVWSNSIDNIVGYVNSKSLFKSPDTIKSVLMSVDYVAETMPLQDMLTHFIKQKSNIAVVIDEFGGTAGIISLEDVLEQIFGEIEDEHDETELVEKELGEGEYVFSCRLEVEYLNEKYGLGIEESDEYDTLAGYIISRYQELPAAGTQMEVDGMKIKILRTTRSRIELAKVQCVKK
jgi:CBS domain containing-hemolysin-like protein